MSDYFTVFGLARKLGVDGEALQRRFYELSREHHPDFHHGADATRQADALAQSALVNRAYRALRDPLARVDYLIALEEGRETREGAGEKPKAPRELLQEMLEVQEALEEAKAEGLGGDAAARLREERGRQEARHRAEGEAVVARFPEWDRLVDGGGDRKPLLEWFKQRLATRAYLRTVIDDLSDALGEREEDHVSDRRH
ncbi:MAG TPA: Fe-S protein assembly co-chaperone HscB [Methylomirabilota bacterium]|nr:Fe-S protein assembly co-chaperone HscB [Methylomirabilota bacterium]